MTPRNLKTISEHGAYYGRSRLECSLPTSSNETEEVCIFGVHGEGMVGELLTNTAEQNLHGSETNISTKVTLHDSRVFNVSCLQNEMCRET